MTATADLEFNGHLAIGHVRYATNGANTLPNLQPHRAKTEDGPIFFASNGDIMNCPELVTKLTAAGYEF